MANVEHYRSGLAHIEAGELGDENREQYEKGLEASLHHTAQPPAPVLEIPTEEEALAAYRKAYAHNPLRTGRGEADVTLALVKCDENASGPGVSCVAAIKRNANAAPLDRVIGFAKSASGEWVATNY